MLGGSLVESSCRLSRVEGIGDFGWPIRAIMTPLTILRGEQHVNL